MSDFLNDADFGKFKTLIYDSSGITFSETNRTILESRLKDRLREKKIADLGEYYNILISNADELKDLLDSVTTNLTRFFRNQPHFDALENYILPELIKIKHAEHKNTIHIWSAGCSTGEEPYSIAMMFKRKLPLGFSAEITASDLPLKSLIVAKQGLYEEAKITGIPDDYLRDYFMKNGTSYQVKPEIRNMIHFDYHNLKHDAKRTDFDLVFCRNVLIYFDEAAQKNVVDKFWSAMSPQSFLFIGHSESLFGMETQFKFLRTDWACLYQKTKK